MSFRGRLQKTSSKLSGFFFLRVKEVLSLEELPISVGLETQAMFNTSTKLDQASSPISFAGNHQFIEFLSSSCTVKSNSH